MSDDKPSESLESLDARLRQARERATASDSSRGPILGSPTSGFGIAFRIGVELVAALIVGVGIGLLLDRWLDTKPWFLVLFFFLGAAAGVLNVYRAASGIGMAPGYGNAESPAGDDKTNGTA